MARDSQRQKLYNFQFAHMKNGRKLTPEECQALVIKAFETFDVTPVRAEYPKVVVTPAKKRFSTWHSRINTIKLAEGWGQHERVVLHEAAHAIRDVFYWSKPFQQREELGWNDGPHGKLFTGIFFALCTKLMADQEPLPNLMGWAKAKKVRFDTAIATTFEEAAPVKRLTSRQLFRLEGLKADLAEAEALLETLTGVAKAHQGNRVKGIRNKIAKLEA